MLPFNKDNLKEGMIVVQGNAFNDEHEEVKRAHEMGLKIYTYQEMIANITNDFEISLGKNYFPEKVYNGVTYKSGYYDSLVITLGNGTGKNFWCVMYPPLCLIDSKESQNVNYKFLLKEVLEKYKA